MDSTKSPNNETADNDDPLLEESSEPQNNTENKLCIHEFDCKDISCDQPDMPEGQIPLKCVSRQKDNQKTIFFVIDEAQVSGDISRLFEDNVKVVIKELMVMDISPK